MKEGSTGRVLNIQCLVHDVPTNITGLGRAASIFNLLFERYSSTSYLVVRSPSKRGRELDRSGHTGWSDEYLEPG